jgi:hypothetical protein
MGFLGDCSCGCGGLIYEMRQVQIFQNWNAFQGDLDPLFGFAPLFTVDVTQGWLVETYTRTYNDMTAFVGENPSYSGFYYAQWIRVIAKNAFDPAYDTVTNTYTQPGGGTGSSSTYFDAREALNPISGWSIGQVTDLATNQSHKLVHYNNSFGQEEASEDWAYSSGWSVDDLMAELASGLATVSPSSLQWGDVTVLGYDHTGAITSSNTNTPMTAQTATCGATTVNFQSDDLFNLRWNFPPYVNATTAAIGSPGSLACCQTNTNINFWSTGFYEATNTPTCASSYQCVPAGSPPSITDWDVPATLFFDNWVDFQGGVISVGYAITNPPNAFPYFGGREPLDLCRNYVSQADGSTPATTC